MNTVSLIMPYYQNANMLARHLQEWLSYEPRFLERIRFIIVDDGSPDKPAKDVIIRTPDVLKLDIMLYRIVDNIPWNQDGARNLAMKACTTDWALMTDMDHLLVKDEAAKLLEFNPEPGHYYMPERIRANGLMYHSHPNTFLFKRSDFWGMGGYDEDFAGAYGSDGNFRKCAKGAGLKETYTRAFALTLFGVEDIEDCNTKDWGRKESSYHRSQHPGLERKAKAPPYKATNPLRFEYRREL